MPTKPTDEQEEESNPIILIGLSNSESEEMQKTAVSLYELAKRVEVQLEKARLGLTGHDVFETSRAIDLVIQSDPHGAERSSKVFLSNVHITGGGVLLGPPSDRSAHVYLHDTRRADRQRDDAIAGALASLALAVAQFRLHVEQSRKSVERQVNELTNVHSKLAKLEQQNRWQEGIGSPRVGEAPPAALDLWTGLDTQRRSWLSRVVELMSEFARTASAGAITKALASPDAAIALNTVLEEHRVGEASPINDGFLDYRQKLFDKAGGVLSSVKVAHLLGITRQAVDKRRSQSKLLGVRVKGDWLYPFAQFRDGALVPGLDKILVLRAGVDGLATLDFLLAPDTALNGLSVLDALRSGGEIAKSAAMIAAGSLGE